MALNRQVTKSNYNSFYDVITMLQKTVLVTLLTMVNYVKLVPVFKVL